MFAAPMSRGVYARKGMSKEGEGRMKNIRPDIADDDRKRSC